VEQYIADLPEVEDARPQLHGAISLGLPDGRAVQLIARGTRLPVEVLQSFSTTADNQSRLEITLVWGEHPLTQDNVPIGTFVMDNLMPAPRGVATLDLSISIDEHEQLTMTATEVSAKRTEILGHIDLSGLRDHERG
jgi:molecular chaperone DnaK (HSP70)